MSDTTICDGFTTPLLSSPVINAAAMFPDPINPSRSEGSSGAYTLDVVMATYSHQDVSRSPVLIFSICGFAFHRRIPRPQDPESPSRALRLPHRPDHRRDDHGAGSLRGRHDTFQSPRVDPADRHQG